MGILTALRDHAAEWVSAGFVAVALGGGWYLVNDDFVADLEFVNVGWWNVRDLSDASRDDAEIQQIAAGMDGVDVMMIGELNDPNALIRLTEALGPSWEWAATAEAIGHSAHSAEYYGFVWDGDIVQLVNGVHSDPDPTDAIDRDPAWATFQTVDGTFDFTVVGVHVTWGGRVGPRKAEIRAMRDVWDRTQAATPTDDDLILVGDFNRNIGDDSFDRVLAVPGMIRANGESGPTHVSSTTTYDQIFLSTTVTTEWTGEYTTGRFDEILFGNDDAAARLAVSDHRPVWITLIRPLADDD